MTDFEKLVKQLGGNTELKPGDVGISNVQARNAQTAAAASKSAAVTPASTGKTNWAKLLGGTLLKGADEAVSGITSTVNNVIGEPAQEVWYMTGLNNVFGDTNPITKVNEIAQKSKAQNQQYFGENASKSKAAQLVDEYGTATAAAIPMAAVALMTAGGSLGAEATTAGLEATSAAAQAPGLATTISTGLKTMAKDPNYWTAYLQTAGNSYDTAKKDGASDLEASAYGMVNGLMNALVEVGGGGIQELPKALRNKSASGVREWVKTMFDEGKENVVQGVIERGLQNVAYGKGNPIASTTNSNAIFNPKTAGNEFASGAIVGGILGGGQSLITKGINARTNVPETEQTAQTGTSDVIKQLAGTAKENAAVQPKAAERATTQDNTQNVITPVQGQNAPTAKQDTPAEIVQPEAQSDTVSPRAMQVVDYLATKMDGNPTFADVRAYASQMGDPNIIKEVSNAISLGALKVGRKNGEIYYNSAYQQPTTAAEESGIGAANKGFTGEPTAFDVWSDNTPASQMHPVGENPTRAIDLPKVNPQGQNTMATARTVMEANATPDERVRQIQQLMVDGQLAYETVSNSALAEGAQQQIDYAGWDKAYTDWTADVRKGKTSPKLTALGATLLNNAGNHPEVTADKYRDLLIDYANLQHTSGQSLQASRILKTLSPESRLYGIQRSVQSMVDEMKDGTDVTIDSDLIDEYRNAQTDEARDDVISKIQQNVADQIPSTLLDKWTALRYVNMLGNFKTQARNVIGNTGMLLLAKIKNETAATLEKLLPADQRTKSIGYSKGMYSAAWKDFLKVQSVALGESKFQEGFDGSQFAREVNGKRTIFKNNGDWGTKTDSSGLAKTTRKVTDTLWKAPEAYRRATNWAMEQGDVIFNRLTYADTLAGYLRAKGYSSEQFTNGQIPDDVLDKARMFAINEAQEATFRDTNALSGWASKVGRRGDTPKAIKVVSEGIAPFRKTPANILVRAEEYSPLGLFNTIVKGIQAKMNVHEVSGADVVNSLAKTLTGSGLAYLGWSLAKAGWLRGKSDDDKQEDFDKLTGQQDYAIQIPGGVSFTLDWLTPGSMPIFVGAQFYNEVARNGFQAGDIEKALTSIGDPLIEMSMLSGINDALDNIKYADNNLGQFALSSAVNYLTQGLTNTMAGQIERTIENTRKTTFTDRDQGFTWLQTALGKASAKTPGVDYNQINYIDAWGRKTDTGSTAGKIANNFFNPAYVSQNNTTALDTELQRLYDAGQTNVLPQRAETSTTVNDEYLTGKEYEQYQTTKGQTSYNILSKAIGTTDYSNMTDEQKAKAVAGAYEYSTYKANRQIAAQRGETSKDSEWDKYADAEKNGIDFWTMWKIKHPEDKNGNGKADEKEQKAVINALAGITPQQKTYLRKSIK